jgi:hypothetical protein
MCFIAEVSEHSAPVKFSSGWLVRLETHFLGGGRYWGRWEIADIGVLVVFRRAAVVQQTKIALLQSKRLYPVEAQTTDKDQSTRLHRRFWQAPTGRTGVQIDSQSQSIFISGLKNSTTG